MKRKEQIIFLERLELYLASGITVDRALNLCADGVSHKQREIIASLSIHIMSGRELSAGLSKFLGISISSAMVVSFGEKLGDLTKSIRSVRSDMEKRDELYKKCVSAGVYPVTIGVFSLIFVVGIMKGVMPQIVPLLQSLHTKLPLLSRIMIYISKIITEHGVWIFIAIVVCVACSAFLIKKSIKIRNLLQKTLVHLPLFGKLLSYYHASSFLRSMASMVEAGIVVSSAFVNAASAQSFYPLRMRLLSCVDLVRDGAMSVSGVISGLSVPTYVSTLCSAGESSGSLGTSLLRGADLLDREVDTTLKRVTSLLEPTMMVVMGTIVGAIALSILLPIYDISKAIQH